MKSFCQNIRVLLASTSFLQRMFYTGALACFLVMPSVFGVSRRHLQHQLNKVCFGCDVGRVRRALANGADVNRFSGGCTPLRIAVEYSTGDVVCLLLEAGADAEIRDSEGLTPLQAAAALDFDREVVRVLLEAGALLAEDADGFGRSWSRR